MFTPDAAHEPEYNQRIPIKIANSPKGPIVACKGSAFTAKLLLEPTLVDLGAVLPASSGQQPKEALLKLVNQSDVDIEVCGADNCLICDTRDTHIWMQHDSCCLADKLPYLNES